MKILSYTLAVSALLVWASFGNQARANVNSMFDYSDRIGAYTDFVQTPDSVAKMRLNRLQPASGRPVIVYTKNSIEDTALIKQTQMIEPAAGDIDIVVKQHSISYSLKPGPYNSDLFD
tara:strand:+ start:733924 stop:734277 length:354 start_codon:yes stop_codon:yes gene_type:complete